MKILKKATFVLYFFVVCFSVVCARESDKPDIEDIINYAQNFACNYSGIELEANVEASICKINGELLGYEVDFEKNGVSFGYLLMDLTKDNPFIQFSIEEKNQGYFESIVERNGLSGVKKILYSFGGMIYGVADDYKIYYSNGMTSDLPDDYTSEITNYYDLSKIYIPYPSGTVLTSGLISKYVNYKSCISQSNIISLTGKYACAVLALTEIAYQEGVLHSGISDTFNMLWNYTDTQVNGSGSGYVTGSTLDSKLIPAMTAYVQNESGNISTMSSSNPGFSFYVNQVYQDYSGTFTYRIWLWDNDVHLYKVKGHTINVLGYKKCLVSGISHDYLAVADGWHSSLTYLCFSDTDFVNSYGVLYNIY